MPMPKTDTVAYIHEHGHRAFVGGDGRFWRQVSRLTFEFIKGHGLRPHHRLLDIACGALRVGSPLIGYLDADRYAGVDKHIELIIYGVADELGLKTFRKKRPRFLVNDRFEFERLEGKFDFALAQSLFSHLTAADIASCLASLKLAASPGCQFFATFFEGETEAKNPAQSHSHDVFHYSRERMEALGRESGWDPAYVGDWGHPRGQKMIIYRA